MFNAATVFVLPPGFTEAGGPLDELQEHLAGCALKPVGPQAVMAIGFVSPFGSGSDVMAHEVAGCVLFSVGTEEKILPTPAILDRMEEQIEKFKEENGRPPGGKMRRELKANVINEMLATAFKKRTRTDAYIDRQRGVVVVGSASRKKAEAVISEVRRALGSFPALPFTTERQPSTVLTGWVSAAGQLPEKLALGEECLLKCEAGGESARLSKHDLGSEEVAHHLEAGKRCQQLEVVYDNRFRLVLAQDLSIRKFKLLDIVLEGMEDQELETAEQAIDARLVLTTGELGTWIDLMRKELAAPPSNHQLELSIVLKAA